MSELTSSKTDNLTLSLGFLSQAKDDIALRQKFREQLYLFHLGALGALLSFSLQQQDHRLLLPIAYICPLFAILVCTHHLKLLDIRDYIIIDLLPWLRRNYPERPLNFLESGSRERHRRERNQERLFANFFILVLPSLAALFFTAPLVFLDPSRTLIQSVLDRLAPGTAAFPEVTLAFKIAWWLSWVPVSFSVLVILAVYEKKQGRFGGENSPENGRRSMLPRFISRRWLERQRKNPPPPG